MEKRGVWMKEGRRREVWIEGVLYLVEGGRKGERGGRGEMGEREEVQREEGEAISGRREKKERPGRWRNKERTAS